MVSSAWLAESLSLKTPALTFRNVGAHSYVNGGYIAFDPSRYEDIYEALIRYLILKNEIVISAERESINIKHTLDSNKIADLLKEVYLQTIEVNRQDHGQKH